MVKYTVLFVVLMVLSCCVRKEEVFITDPSARLTFSEEVVLYDTLFAELTYPQQRLKVYNRNNGALAISEVSLAGGSASPFKMIVNGQQGPVVRDLQLMGGDSLLLFVDLFFNSSSQTLPYLIEDSIRFVVNGQEQKVLLKAVGRDAVLVASGDLPCATTWNNSKPIVLLGQTTVPPGCTLTIMKGTQVLASRGSALDIQGTLLVTGEKAEPVFFGGLVSGKEPGQWQGIRFYEGSAGNQLSWLELENAINGLSFASTGTPATTVDITLDHAVFHDFTQSALNLSYTNLTASNCLFFAASGSGSTLSKTGSYAFDHCTWAGYSFDYYREAAAIHVPSVTGTLSLQLKHSIVWGDKSTELTYDPATILTVNACIVKSVVAVPGTAVQQNQDPLFKVAVTRDFQLKPASPAIDKGTTSVLTDDLKGASRDALPDLGCYEYVP